ncbi:MAG TPA: hypothetical protein VFU32_13470 [Ktedonobacterales bacterium]|nr:hypothetical protein [Ktedonobacterales bacterium]
MESIIVFAALALLGVFALFCGADTSGSDDQERERRQHWPGFGGDGKYTA